MSHYKQLDFTWRMWDEYCRFRASKKWWKWPYSIYSIYRGGSK